MYIKNSLTENFGDFKLDTNAIGMYSKSTQDIMLPYNGNLPEKMSPASDAFIHVNVSPTRGASISLSVNANGKKIRRPIEASNQEIIDLLNRLFHQTEKNIGLNPLWRGYWSANYIEWQNIVGYPLNLLHIIEELPVKEQAYIISRWLEPLKESLDVGASYSNQFKVFRDWIMSAPLKAIRSISGRKWLTDIPNQ